MPPGQGQVTAMGNAGVFANHPCPECRALAIVKVGDTLRARVSSTGEVAAIELRHAPEKKSFHEDAGIVKAFAESHCFLSEIGADLEIAAHDMICEISPHDREKLWCLSYPLTQRVGAAENGANFCRRVTSPCDVSSTQW